MGVLKLRHEKGRKRVKTREKHFWQSMVFGIRNITTTMIIT